MNFLIRRVVLRLIPGDFGCTSNAAQDLDKKSQSGMRHKPLKPDALLTANSFHLAYKGYVRSYELEGQRDDVR